MPPELRAPDAPGSVIACAILGEHLQERLPSNTSEPVRRAALASNNLEEYRDSILLSNLPLSVMEAMGVPLTWGPVKKLAKRYEVRRTWGETSLRCELVSESHETLAQAFAEWSAPKKEGYSFSLKRFEVAAAYRGQGLGMEMALNMANMVRSRHGAPTAITWPWPAVEFPFELRSTLAPQYLLAALDAKEAGLAVQARMKHALAA